jgi:hypothetical protein
MRDPYVTIAADPAAFAAALERAKEYTYRRTCPLLAGSQRPLEHIASCVLVQAGDSALAITAAHAVDNIRRTGGVPAISIVDEVASQPLVLPCELAESVPPQDDRNRDRIDVAAISILGGVTRLGVAREVVALKEVDVHYEPAEGDVVVVHGFPVERASESDHDGVPGVRAESAYFYSAPSAELPRKVRPRDGTRAPSFSLRYNRKPPVRIGLTGKAPHPRGLGGSGAWLLGSTNPESGKWAALEYPRLVGIVQEWHPAEEAMVVTRAAQLTPCIYLCPGASEAALEAFPELAAIRRIEKLDQRL